MRSATADAGNATHVAIQVSLTSATLLHNTQLAVMQWFWAAYLMTTDTRGVSELLVQRLLALRRYETASVVHAYRSSYGELWSMPSASLCT